MLSLLPKVTQPGNVWAGSQTWQTGSQSVGIHPPGSVASVSEMKCSGCFNKHEKELVGKLCWGLKAHLLRGLATISYTELGHIGPWGCLVT